MNPTRFGPPARQLFGIHEAPASGSDRGQGVLVCNPFGQEAIRCHRLLRMLGERLARTGFHVLRFDYFATGDSDGDDAEGSIAAWSGDILLAHEELQRLAGVNRVSWFGLRLGAALAAIASAQAAQAPERLVLCEPVLDGGRYLEEIGRAHASERIVLAGAAPSDPAADATAGKEVFGFPLTALLREQIGAITAASYAESRAAQVWIVGAAAAAEVARLEGLPDRGRASLRARQVGEKFSWASDDALNAAVVPVDVLQAIASALAGET